MSGNVLVLRDMTLLLGNMICCTDPAARQDAGRVLVAMANDGEFPPMLREVLANLALVVAPETEGTDNALHGSVVGMTMN
jgi:hypothetical protein